MYISGEAIFVSYK